MATLNLANIFLYIHPYLFFDLVVFTTRDFFIFLKNTFEYAILNLPGGKVY